MFAGILRTIIKGGLGIYSLIKPNPANPDKPQLKTTDLIMLIVSKIFPMVTEAISSQNLTTREQFDQWLILFDNTTGADAAAIDIIKGMSPIMEEKFFDHIIEAARVYGYWIIDGHGDEEIDISKVAELSKLMVLPN